MKFLYFVENLQQEDFELVKKSKLFHYEYNEETLIQNRKKLFHYWKSNQIYNRVIKLEMVQQQINKSKFVSFVRKIFLEEKRRLTQEFYREVDWDPFFTNFKLKKYQNLDKSYYIVTTNKDYVADHFD